MLIIKAFVNERQIDEIHIHNEGRLYDNEEIKICEYKVLEPGGYDKLFIHDQSDGWMALAAKVLEELK